MRKGLLCVFDLAAIMSQRHATTRQRPGDNVSGDNVSGDGGSGDGGGSGDSENVGDRGGDGDGDEDADALDYASFCDDGTVGRFSFAEEALALFRTKPPTSAGILSPDTDSFDPYQPPPASPAAMFTTSSFIDRLWSRGGLAPAVRDEVEAATRAALQVRRRETKKKKLSNVRSLLESGKKKPRYYFSKYKLQTHIQSTDRTRALTPRNA